MKPKTYVPKMNLRILRAKCEEYQVYLNMSKQTTNLLIIPLKNTKSGPHILELMLDWEAWVKDAMVRTRPYFFTKNILIIRIPATEAHSMRLPLYYYYDVLNSGLSVQHQLDDVGAIFWIF